jgi:glycosyltransferase involved in cell wall biosynthesis
MRNQQPPRIAPLRIALVPPLWAPIAPGTAGGVEYIVYLLAQELVRRGHEVTVFTSADSPTAAALESVFDTSMLEAMERGRAWEYEYYETSNIAEALRRSRSFDVIHFHVGAYAIPLGALSSAPVIHTLHNPVTPDAIWLLNRYPDAAVTSVSRQQIAGIPDGRRRRIRVVHNGCDFAAFELGASPGGYLAFLGRMGPGKSPHEAIRVADEAGLPIVLAGQALDDEERSYFAAQIQPRIDGRKVVYLGPVDHRRKVELLKGAAALLFPIQAEEAFGMVMIEAMACGTPVIACRRSAVAELIDYGITGFYADDVGDLASLVPAARALDRRVVRAHAERRFSHLRMADEYIEAYDAARGVNPCAPALATAGRD